MPFERINRKGFYNNNKKRFFFVPKQYSVLVDKIHKHMLKSELNEERLQWRTQWLTLMID